ncbi:MAG: hydroxylamine reductase, partial [Spirochaetota bacterium]|nr:hydroxylamine reductase [Spirochaetota bacterium]
MFCYQCQETAKGEGCTVNGVCGKKGDVANLQDLLIYVLKGISVANIKLREAGVAIEKVDEFVMENLFSTITNVNFDRNDFIDRIKSGLALKKEINKSIGETGISLSELHDSVIWHSSSVD